MTQVGLESSGSYPDVAAAHLADKYGSVQRGLKARHVQLRRNIRRVQLDSILGWRP
jgi:hypothetical protein